MSGRTFAIGDIHGELEHLHALFSCFPTLGAGDTIVFVGDYMDRGPSSREVVEFVRTELPKTKGVKVVALRGNHEDAWLRVIDHGWPAFVLPPSNGCLATMRSFLHEPMSEAIPSPKELETLLSGKFFPAEVVSWMRDLPYFYEDEHAIYVHAGIPKKGDVFPHPSEVEDKTPLLWIRTEDFFKNYRGKRVVFGHTTTDCLPQELSSYTPDDPTDLWAGEDVIGIDTGCGRGGFLTAIEFPALNVYESRADPV